MSGPVTPSPETGTGIAPSPTPGNETGGRGDVSPQATPQDPTGLNRDQLLQQMGRLQEELNARNRDYAASKQHGTEAAQLLRERNAQLEQLSTQYQITQSELGKLKTRPATPASPAAPSPDAGFLSKEEVEQMQNAVLEGNTDTFRTGLENFGSRLISRYDTQRTQQETNARRQQAAFASLQQIGGQDLANNPALAQRALAHYARLQSDPIRSAAAPDTTITIGNMELNAHILKDAIYETRIEAIAAAAQARNTGDQSSDNFALGGGNVSTPGLPESGYSPKLDPDTNEDHASRLMSADEKAYCDSKNLSYAKSFFKWLPEPVKAARLREGKWIDSGQVGRAEKITSFSIPAKRTWSR